MKIVCISDTHGHHRRIDLPQGDILVFAGDFDSKGGPQPQMVGPLDTDVLITHGPPFGLCDTNSKGVRMGCKDLREIVQERVQPKVHIFGHNHEGYGAVKVGSTTFVNASICTAYYAPTNAPIVIEVAGKHDRSKLGESSR